MSTNTEFSPAFVKEDSSYIGEAIHGYSDKRFRFPILTSSTCKGGIGADAETGCVKEIKYIFRHNTGSHNKPIYPNEDQGTVLYYCDDAKSRLQTHYIAHGQSPIRVLFVNGSDDYDRGYYAIVNQQCVESTKHQNGKIARFVLQKLLHVNGTETNTQPVCLQMETETETQTEPSLLRTPPKPATQTQSQFQTQFQTQSQTQRTPYKVGDGVHSDVGQSTSYHYRSKLEAKHAALYTNLHLVWTYERYTLSLESPRYGDASTQSYTPDFALHNIDIPLLRQQQYIQQQMYFVSEIMVEVKPAWPHDDELRKCELVALRTRRPLLLAYGRIKNPHARCRPSSDDLNSEKNYGHSDGLRFAIYDANGLRLCSDAVLMMERNGNVIIDVRRSVTDERVYHPRLVDAFEQARKRRYS